jgi:hypothetical protein
MSKLVSFFFLFLFLTPIGCLLHEMGHCLAAEYYGVKPILHFDRTTTFVKDIAPKIDLLIIVWGILSTLLIGTFGFIMAILKRTSSNLIILWVSLAFFWSRELFNLFVSLFLTRGNYTDEVMLAQALQIPKLTIATTLGVIGFFIITYCVFIIIPQKTRYQFIVGGILGSVFGWIFWFHWLGPLLLP